MNSHRHLTARIVGGKNDGAPARVNTLGLTQRLRYFFSRSHSTCPLCESLHGARVTTAAVRSDTVEIALDCAECGAKTTITRKA